MSEVARQTQTLRHVLEHSLPVCQRLAASIPSPIPAFLSVPSSLAQFPPAFGVPFLEKTRSKQKPVALLQPGFCLPSVPVCSLRPHPGIQDAAGPGKRGRRIVPWALLFRRGVKALFYHYFPSFPVFPKVPVLPGGSSISRLVAGFPKVGAKEVERAQGQPRWRHESRLVIFLLFEQNWALDGLSLSQLIMPQAAQIFPKPWASERNLETAGGKISY